MLLRPRFILAPALVLAASLDSNAARAEVRSLTLPGESFRVAYGGPNVFVTRAQETPTAPGRASCNATFSGKQKVGFAELDTQLKVVLEVPFGAVLASATGASPLSVTGDVPPEVAGAKVVQCKISLVQPALPGSAEGTLTTVLPMDVQPPVVTQTYVLGGTSQMNVARREASYGPPGAFVSIDGKFLRNARVTVAGVPANVRPGRSDSALAFDVPNARPGPTQLVIDNGLARVGVPFVVGIPAPTITRAVHNGTNLIIDGQYLDPVVPGRQAPITVKVGGTVFKVRVAMAGSLWVEAPSGTRGVVTVETAGGTATGPDLGAVILPPHRVAQPVEKTPPVPPPPPTDKPGPPGAARAGRGL